MDATPVLNAGLKAGGPASSVRRSSTRSWTATPAAGPLRPSALPQQDIVAPIRPMRIESAPAACFNTASGRRRAPSPIGTPDAREPPPPTIGRPVATYLPVSRIESGVRSKPSAFLATGQDTRNFYGELLLLVRLVEPRDGVVSTVGKFRVACGEEDGQLGL